MGKSLKIIPLAEMTSEEQWVWIEKMSARASENYDQAAKYYQRMHEHHQSVNELIKLMRIALSKEQTIEVKEEVSDIESAFGEVMDAMKCLKEQSLSVSLSSKSIEQIEDEVVSTDTGKAAVVAVEQEIKDFLKKYNAVKSRLGLKTQQDVANLTGFDRRQISRIESGDFKPQFKTIQKLADGFNVPVTDLI